MSSVGRWTSCGAVVKKRAVCSHPVATLTLEGTTFGGLEGMCRCCGCAAVGWALARDPHCRIARLRTRKNDCCDGVSDMKRLAFLVVSVAFLASTHSALAADPKPAAAASAAAAAKPDPAKGRASYDAICLACHGAEGNSGIPVNPKLAGQHREYTVKQLQEFKSGKRNNPVMKGFATALSDEDMKSIAVWLAANKPKAGAAKDKNLVALGERIYRGGIADRQIAACASCHSPNGAGMPAQYPRLSGQHAEYTSAQLVAFRDGVRQNSLQMTQVANKLNDREIKALGEYISGLR